MIERQPQKKPDASHKRTRTIALALLIAVAVLLLFWMIWNNTNRARPSPGPSATSSGNAAVQTNEGGQVTIKVTWQGRSAGPIFTVEMDTHTMNLDSYDLLLRIPHILERVLEYVSGFVCSYGE